MYDSIFVWEEINLKLKERGVEIPSWNNELQIALIESYLLSFAKNIKIPSRDILNLKTENGKSNFYVNIPLLNQIMISASVLNDFYRLSPQGVLFLMNIDEFLTYKMTLYESSSEIELLLNASKYRKFLIKSLNKSIKYGKKLG